MRVPKGKGHCRAYPVLDNIALRTDESYRLEATTFSNGVVKKSPLLFLRGFCAVWYAIMSVANTLPNYNGLLEERDVYRIQQ